jgi:hypothetical protein
MGATDDSKCVAVFDQHQEAEAAIKELQRVGYDMKKLSIVGRDYFTEEHAVGFYNGGDRVRHWGKLGAFWGGLFGIVAAPAFFWIPGIGPILTGGLIGSFLMGTIEGAAVGAAVVGGTSALAAALTSMGIPKDSVIRYEEDIRANKFLLIANGNSGQVEQARSIVAARRGQANIHAR